MYYREQMRVVTLIVCEFQNDKNKINILVSGSWEQNDVDITNLSWNGFITQQNIIHLCNDTRKGSNNHEEDYDLTLKMSGFKMSETNAKTDQLEVRNTWFKFQTRISGNLSW